MKRIRSILAWVLVFAMVCTNVEYVSAATVTEDNHSDEAENAVLETVSAGDYSGDVVAAAASETEDQETEKETESDAENQADAEENLLVEDAVETSASAEAVNTVDTYGSTASGKFHGMDWVLDEDGLLTISGACDSETDGWISPVWLYYKDYIKSAKVTATDVTSTCDWFNGCENLVSVDLSGFDTSKTTRMDEMFTDCKSLTSLDLSDFDVSKVTDFYRMFAGCESLEELDLSNFNTESAERMPGMFENCKSLKSLDLRSFTTSKVVGDKGHSNDGFSQMFSGCVNLTHVNLSSFDTSQATDMSYMFKGCEALQELDLSNFDTRNVVDMSYMFYDCGAPFLDVSNFDMSNVTECENMFHYFHLFSNSSRLKAIRTFKNLQQTIALPLKMYDADGQAYSEFPKGLEESITLLRKAPGNTAESITVKSAKDLQSDHPYGVNEWKKWVYDVPEAKSVAVTFSEDTSLEEGHDYLYLYTGESEWKKDEYGVNVEEEIVRQYTGKELAGKTVLFHFEEWESGYKPSPCVTIELKTDDAGCDYGFSVDNVVTETLVDVQSIQLDQSELSLELGEQETLTINYTPEVGDASVQGRWSSSDESVAKVANGYVTATGLGKATITAQYGDLIAECQVQVSVSGKYEGMDWKLDADGLLTIEGEYTGVYTSASNSWRNDAYRELVKRAKVTATGVTTTDDWFKYLTNLTEIDLSGFDTSNVTSMQGMFYGCSSLTSLDVSKFDTSKVTRMREMFSGCKNLKNLDVSHFDTSQVEFMANMFFGCSALTELNVSNFDTGKADGTGGMFYGCSGLTELDVSHFSTGQMTHMNGMFADCSGLTELDLGNFDTGKVTTMSNMFSGCSGLTELNLSNFDTGKVTTMSNMFSDCSGLTELDLSGFDTGQVTDMSYMFSNCTGLGALNLGSFNTAAVTDMSNMFSNCSGLLRLDLSKFDLSGITGKSGMNSFLYNCGNLRQIRTIPGLQYEVSLPVKPLYDAAGTEYTKLPTELETSILLIENKDAFTSDTAIYASDVDDLQSAHPYADNTNQEWIYEAAGAKGMEVAFSADTALEEHDYIYLYNADGSLAGKYTGTELAGKTIAVLGDCFTIRFASDESGTAYGFKVDQVTRVVPVERLVQSQKNIKLSIGATQALKVDFDPVNATTTLKMEWSSADESVATVDAQGVVTAVGKGTTIVTATLGEMQISYKIISGAIVASGEESGIKWTLDEEGLLMVYGTDTRDYEEESYWEYRSSPDWASYNDQIKSVKITAENVKSTYCWFEACIHLTSVDFSEFDSSKVVTMAAMFRECHELESIDVSHLDTSQVRDMSSMFSRCDKLKSVDLSNFDTRQVTDMGGMFYFCEALETVNVSSFHTENVTDMYGMFDFCTKLQELDLSNFDMGNVTGAGNMLYNCRNLSDVKFPKNVKISISLPVSPMYTADGKAYTEFPMNQTESITLTSDTSKVHFALQGIALDQTTLNMKPGDTATLNVIYTPDNTTDNKFTDWESSNRKVAEVTSSGIVTAVAEGTATISVKVNNEFEATCAVTVTSTGEETASFAITFDTNGGEAVTPATRTVDKGTAYGALPIPTRNGYTFDGWYTAKDGGEKVTAATICNQAATIYAHWTEVQTIGGHIDNGTEKGIDWSIDADGKLTISGTGDFEKLEVKTQEDFFGNPQTVYIASDIPWTAAEYRSLIKTAVVDLTDVTTTVSMFVYCINLTNVDVKKLDTSKVTNMCGMFQLCDSLEELDLSGFDTSNVEVMESMFSGCGALKSVKLSGWNTAKVTDMSYMFEECDKLAEVNLSSFDTSNVTAMRNMFSQCESLDTLDLGSFDLSKLTDPNAAMGIVSLSGTTRIRTFKNCAVDIELPNGPMLDENGNEYTNFPKNLSEGIWLSCKPVSDHFDNGTAKGVDWSIDAAGKLTVTGEGSFSKWPGRPVWESYAYRVKSVDFSNFDFAAVTDMGGMFSGCKKLKSIDLSNFNTDKVTNMRAMFSECNQLTKLDLSRFNTAHVTDFGIMFNECTMLTELDLSNFDTSSATNMNAVFRLCQNLKNVNLSSFNTSSVTDMSYMFYGCRELENVDISSFDTHNVKDMQGMFSECRKLKSLDLGNFDVSNVTEMASFVSDCDSITAIKWVKNYTRLGEYASPELPVSSMYDSQGKEYTSFPEGLAQSIWLYSSKIVAENSPSSYTVTFDVGRGEALVPNTKSVTDGTAYGTLPIPARKGYIFQGWFTELKGGVQVTAASICTGDITLYAHWQSEKGGDGVQLSLADPDEVYTYTGSAIKPAILFTNNGEELVEGVDYSVKYKNNINANTDLKSSNAPAVIITAKGNLKGTYTMTFAIEPKRLTDEDVLKGDVVTDNAAKAVPVLVYNGLILKKNKDFQYQYNAVSNEKGNFSVTGKGNYTDTVSVNVSVKDKSALQKFAVKVTADKNTLVYDGTPKTVTVQVTDSKGKNVLTENKDYVLAYSNNVDAGSAKVMVVGIGNYSGAVVKKFTIKPAKPSVRVENTNSSAAGRYAFASAGVRIDEDLAVYASVGSVSNKLLVKGRDYKVTYSANKKVGAAKYKITFLGNYKGTKPVSGSFTIKAASLSDAKVVVGDKAYTGKPGTYTSTPYISVDNVALKKSDYTCTYYSDQQMTKAIDKSSPITLEENQKSATVYVKIEGKGNYGDTGSGYLTAKYEVYRSKNDLGKAKITLTDEKGNKLSKAEYTGSEIEPKVLVTLDSGKNAATVPADQYTVEYIGNVNKGKGTVIITAAGDEYAGSKAVTFSIAQGNLLNYLKSILGN